MDYDVSMPLFAGHPAADPVADEGGQPGVDAADAKRHTWRRGARLLAQPLLVMSSGVLLALLVFVGLASTFMLAGVPAKGDPPYCRKSTSLAVLPGHPDAVANGSSNASTGASASAGHHPSMQLLLWSGIGLHKAIFDDMHAFDLKQRQWKQVEAGPGPCPVSRWKAGNAQAVAGGMVVVGGDAYTPHTRKHRYENDVWRLDYPSLAWTQARVDPTSPAPAPRRGHSTMLYQDAEGVDHIVVFGGRTRDKVLLNDAWEVALTWPTVSWQCVTPQWQPPDNRSLPDAPDVKGPHARRGHSATLIDDADTPQMLVYGGREDLDYFGDLWLLDIQGRQWHQIQPATNVTPPARDHHSAAYANGKLYVWGGRSGPTYRDSKPRNDLWAFDLRSRTWEEIKQRSRLPLPRFEESYAQYTVPGTSEVRLVVFGGQAGLGTDHECQLNDVWELSLTTFDWKELSAPHFCTKKCREPHKDI